MKKEFVKRGLILTFFLILCLVKNGGNEVFFPDLLSRRILNPSVSQYPPQIQEWLKALDSPNNEEVLRALTEIGRSQFVPNRKVTSLRDASALAQKIFGLLGRSEENIRAEAVFALSALMDALKMDKEMRDKTLNKMYPLLKDESEKVRLATVHSLSMTSDALSGDDKILVNIAMNLIEVLKDPSSLVAGSSLSCLVSIVKKAMTTREGKEQVIIGVLEAQQEGAINPDSYVQFMLSSFYVHVLSLSPVLKSAIEELRSQGRGENVVTAFLQEESTALRSVALRELFYVSKHTFDKKVQREAIYAIDRILYKGIKEARKDLISIIDVSYLISEIKTIFSEEYPLPESVQDRNFIKVISAKILESLPFYIEGNENIRMQLAEQYVSLLNHHLENVREAVILGLSKVLLGGVFTSASMFVKKDIATLSLENARIIIEKIKEIMADPLNKLSEDNYRILYMIIHEFEKRH